MKLIEFETRLEKDDENDMFPYRFKNYAKVSLSFQDAKDIELILTLLKASRPALSDAAPCLDSFRSTEVLRALEDQPMPTTFQTEGSFRSVARASTWFDKSVSFRNFRVGCPCFLLD